MGYGMKTTVAGSFQAVKDRVVQALKAEGFGILSEIDVQKTLRDKIGVDMERYEILGACNPQLAHRALTADRDIGLLLPCNVVLREVGDGVEVAIADPDTMFEAVGEATRRELADLPGEARARLQRSLEAIG